MIKLVTCDLDGTLLNDQKQLPHNFREILYALKARGVAFAVASGRSYSGVEYIFGDMARDMYFICDNGAFTVENGEVIDISLIQTAEVHKIFDCVRDIGNVDVLVCGKMGTYYTHCNEKMKNMMTSFYTNTIFVENLYDIEDDIFKISIGDFYNPLENSYPYISQRLSDCLSIHVSGNIWVDIMALGIDKGQGVKKLQQKLGVLKAETMAFGDFYNDLPMLENAGLAFVMENAHEAVKSHATHIAKSCNDEGVILAIEEFILNK